MKFSILILILFSSYSAIANNSNANINKGNLEAGGSAVLGYSHFSKFNIGMAPDIQYFVADDISFGGEISGELNTLSSSVGGGPKVAFYFWSSEKWVADVALSVFFSRSSVSGQVVSGFTNYFDILPSASLLYFVRPSVAVGPTLRVDVPVNRRIYDGTTDISGVLFAKLSVYF